jgi:integrase
MSMRRSHDSATYCYTPEQVASMIELCRADPELAWLGDLILAMATSGMRIGEMCSLRRSDIDMEAGFIRLPDNRHSARQKKLGSVRKLKNRHARVLPLHGEIKAVLSAMSRHADGRVFHGPLGGVLKADTVRNILIRSVIKPLSDSFPTPDGEVGFKHGRLHSFRHFFVSQAFLGGVSEGEIRDWVGHRDTKIIERYRHLRHSDSQRKMSQIDFLGAVTKRPAPVAPPTEAGESGKTDPNSNHNSKAADPGVPDQP